MQKMKKAKNAAKIMAILLALFFSFSCNPLEDDSDSNSLLTVVEILGTDAQGNQANYLHSDVIVIDSDTGEAGVFDDPATVTLRATLLDPTPGAQSSQYNSIRVTRYVVSFFRSDGKNTPGVDIPYSFEGSLSTLIDIGTTTNISFIIVRHVAKLEPPLIELANSTLEGGDELVMQVTARIDFYGHDMINHKVKATGYLTIFFANFADE